MFLGIRGAYKNLVCLTHLNHRNASARWHRCGTKKSGPITGATFQRGRKAGKSGKTLQGVVLSSRTRFRKLSRTLGCGEGHSGGCGLFCCSVNVHLPSQSDRSQRALIAGIVSHCKGEAYICSCDPVQLGGAEFKPIARCIMLHIRCRALLSGSLGASKWHREKPHPAEPDGVFEKVCSLF